ncbi:hypothetical protein BVX93_02065, partial [bacterium B13(2017)]
SPYLNNSLSSEDFSITTFSTDWSFELLSIQLEYRINDSAKSLQKIWNNFDLNPYSKELIGGKLSFDFTNWLNIYLGGQETVQGESNNQYFFGTQIGFHDKYYIGLEQRNGTIGESLSLYLTQTNTDDTNQSMSFNKSQENYSFDFNRTEQITPFNQLTFSNKISLNKDRMASSNNIISETYVNETWRWGVGYEDAYLEEEIRSAISRESANLWYRFIHNKLTIKGKAEWREDSQEKNIITEAFYFEKYIKWLSDFGLSLTGKASIGYADNPKTEKEHFEFVDGYFGIAYRPLNYSFINLIGKYVYLTDLYPENRELTFIENSEFKKHIFSFGFNLDLFSKIELNETFHLRNMKDKTGNRSWQESKTQLWINALSWKFYKDFKCNLEYRMLNQITFDNIKKGYLFELLFPIKNMIYFGLGYNFTSFDDDLANDDDYDVKGPFIRITGVY